MFVLGIQVSHNKDVCYLGLQSRRASLGAEYASGGGPNSDLEIGIVWISRKRLSSEYLQLPQDRFWEGYIGQAGREPASLRYIQDGLGAVDKSAMGIWV